MIFFLNMEPFLKCCLMIIFPVLTYADMPGEDDGEGCSLTSHDLDTPPPYPNHHRPSHKGLPHIEMVRPAQDSAANAAAEAKKEEKKGSSLISDKVIYCLLRFS